MGFDSKRPRHPRPCLERTASRSGSGLATRHKLDLTSPPYRGNRTPLGPLQVGRHMGRVLQWLPSAQEPDYSHSRQPRSPGRLYRYHGRPSLHRGTVAYHRRWRHDPTGVQLVFSRAVLRGLLGTPGFPPGCRVPRHPSAPMCLRGRATWYGVSLAWMPG
jgi:hypothetical protein